MPEELTTLTLIAAVIAVMGLIVYFLPYIVDPGGTPEGAVPAGEILQRVADETCHRAPEYPYTVEDAHAVMRERLDCTIDRCAAKRMAYSTLVESGRIIPASERRL